LVVVPRKVEETIRVTYVDRVWILVNLRNVLIQILPAIEKGTCSQWLVARIPLGEGISGVEVVVSGDQVRSCVGQFEVDSSSVLLANVYEENRSDADN